MSKAGVETPTHRGTAQAMAVNHSVMLLSRLSQIHIFRKAGMSHCKARAFQKGRCGGSLGLPSRNWGGLGAYTVQGSNKDGNPSRMFRRQFGLVHHSLEPRFKSPNSFNNLWVPPFSRSQIGSGGFGKHLGVRGYLPLSDSFKSTPKWQQSPLQITSRLPKCPKPAP